MKKEIFIIGSGGFAKEVGFLLEQINRSNNNAWKICGYVDTKEKRGLGNGKYSVVLNDYELSQIDRPVDVVVGIGNGRLTKKIIDSIRANNNISFPNIIHPNFEGDNKNIKIGMGNVITSNNIFTTDIEIGSFNIFNLSCTLGHDTIIGNYNVFNPTVNISGGINIGDQNLVGTGSQLLQYLNIKNEITIGAGAVVSKSLEEPGIYVGIPARKMKN